MKTDTGLRVPPQNGTAVTPNVSLELSGSQQDDVQFRISELVRQLEDLALAVGSKAARRREAGSSSLMRLLQGRGTDNDVALLPVNPVGGRVLVMHCSLPQVMSALHPRLDQVRNSCWVALSATETAVLLAESPRRVNAGQLCAAASLAERVADPSVALRVGISSLVPTCAALPAACQEAMDAGDLAREQAIRWSTADDNWAEIGRRRLRQALSDALTLDNPLLRLASYDAIQRTEFLPSVTAWLRANCDTGVAADNLGIHPNTLRYRLRRAHEVSGLDLEDPDARVLAVLVGTQKGG